MLDMVASTLIASCFPIDPGTVSVLDATFQIDAGSAVIEEAIDAIEEPSDVDAASTAVFVLPFTTAAIELDAMSVCAFTFAVTPAVAVFVFALTTAAIELDAALTSDWSASEPELKPAPVSVRVPFVHTSAASVPNVVRLRVPFAQTLPGIAVIDDASVVRVEPSDVEAVNTALLVFPFITAASEVVAVTSAVSV